VVENDQLGIWRSRRRCNSITYTSNKSHELSRTASDGKKYAI
jgi:hypothetical protein